MNQQPIGIIGAMKMEVDAILAAMEASGRRSMGAWRSQRAPFRRTLRGRPMLARQGERRPVHPGFGGLFQPPPGAEPGRGRRHWRGRPHWDVVIATACVEYDFDTSALDQWPAGQLTLPGQEGPCGSCPVRRAGEGPGRRRGGPVRPGAPGGGRHGG